ncbi:hypothetical protein NFJ02_33g84290 [Pycnococcus provasolii]
MNGNNNNNSNNSNNNNNNNNVPGTPPPVIASVAGAGAPAQVTPETPPPLPRRARRFFCPKQNKAKESTSPVKKPATLIKQETEKMTGVGVASPVASSSMMPPPLPAITAGVGTTTATPNRLGVVGGVRRRNVPPTGPCKLCGKRLPPIGRARRNGASHHNDWETREYHKKCWKSLRFPSYYGAQPSRKRYGLWKRLSSYLM